MSIVIKLIIIFSLLYLGFRWFTKPFREAVKQARNQATGKQRGGQQQSQPAKEKNTKTEELGDYIDYEEIEE